MIRTRHPQLAASLFLLLGATAAPAQYRDDIPPPPPVVAERTVVTERTVVANQPQEIQLGGEVLRTKQVDDRVNNERVLAALLDVGDGRRQVVELGPVRIYKDTPIYSGDQIAVFGPRVRLGNADVVLASEVHVAGETVVVPRPGPVTAAGYVVTSPEVKIYGRLEALKPARLRDSRSDHVIARVVDRNGGVVVVDLGPQGALWRADLRSGDWITIYGQQMQVGDRSAILAREINKGGIPLLLDRELVADPLAPAAVVTQRVVAP
jgi:hypothetical protein